MSVCHDAFPTATAYMNQQITHHFPDCRPLRPEYKDPGSHDTGTNRSDIGMDQVVQRRAPCGHAAD